MIVSGVSLKSTTKIRFTGTLLNSADITSCEVSFLGLASDTCSLSADGTTVDAKFTGGVPTTSEDVTPELKLVTTTATHYAVIDPAAVLRNPQGSVIS